jgi:hypothetical protein
MHARGKDAINVHNVERILYLVIPKHYLELNTLAHGSTLSQLSRIAKSMCAFESRRNGGAPPLKSIGWLLIVAGFDSEYDML